MPHHGNEEEHGSSRDQGSKRDEPVIRDHRKVDPVTGEARHPTGEKHAEPVVEPLETSADSDGDALAQAEEILNRVEVPAEESVAQGVSTGSTTAEATELKNDLLRLQAEYVNYKRRVDRDRELVKQNAQYSVLSGLLPVLDDIDRAREHGEVEGGFKAVADSLERIVLGLGLEKFGSPGDEFDPNLHEALMHAHSPDVTTTTCQNIIQAGYRIGERVVRPARVTVVDPEPAGDR